MGRLRPFAWHLSVTRSLVSICMPQGCDGVQVVALSIGPLCRHDITRSDRQIGNISVTYLTLVPWWREWRHYVPMPQSWTIAGCLGLVLGLLSVKPDEWMHLSLRYAKFTSQYSLAFSLKVRDDWGFQVNPLCRHDITSPFPHQGTRVTYVTETFSCSAQEIINTLWMYSKLICLVDLDVKTIL